MRMNILEQQEIEEKQERNRDAAVENEHLINKPSV